MEALSQLELGALFVFRAGDDLGMSASECGGF